MDERSSGHQARTLAGRLRETLGRPLPRLACAILLLLYGFAAFAPLIASDRPYVMTVVDRRAYTEALGALGAISGELARWSQGREPGPALGRPQSIELERRAAERRLDQLRDWLPAAERAALEPWSDALREWMRADEAGDREASERLGQLLLERARDLRSRLRPAHPERPSEGGVELVARRRFPLFASLGGLEVGAMCAWFVLCALPWLLRAGRGARLAAWITPPAVGLLWALASGGGGRGVADHSIKEGLLRGEIVAVRAPVFPPLAYGPNETHTLEGLRAPSWTRARGEPPGATQVRPAEPAADSRWRWLAGTDSLGRDLLARMLWGARVSLSVGLVSAALLTLLGLAAGAAAGYYGGWIDFLVLRAVEVLQSIPAFFLVLLAMAFTDARVVPPMLAIVCAISLVSWTGAARLVRGEFLRLREREFVLAARALGFGHARILLRHVLPNALGPLLVHAAFAVSAGILTESAISYLGFGIRYPEASWGSLVNESRNPEHWWIQLFPGLLIFLTVTCYNLVGDAVRDALDPRLAA